MFLNIIIFVISADTDPDSPHHSTDPSLVSPSKSPPPINTVTMEDFFPSSFGKVKPKRKRYKHTHDYRCDICGKKATSYSSIETHKFNKHGIIMKAERDPDKKYQCFSCGNVFKSMLELHQHHRKKHNTEKDLKKSVYKT